MQHIFKRPLATQEACILANIPADIQIFCTFFNIHFNCSAVNASPLCTSFLIDPVMLLTAVASLGGSITIPTILTSSVYSYVAPFIPDHVDQFNQPAGYMATVDPCSWPAYERWQCAQGAKGKILFFFLNIR